MRLFKVIFKNIMNFCLTLGIAAISITAHVDAGFPVISEINPAAIPPRIPPTSNKVDKLAAVEGSICLPKKKRDFFSITEYEILILVCI